MTGRRLIMKSCCGNWDENNFTVHGREAKKKSVVQLNCFWLTLVFAVNLRLWIFTCANYIRLQQKARADRLRTIRETESVIISSFSNWENYIKLPSVCNKKASDKKFARQTFNSWSNKKIKLVSKIKVKSFLLCVINYKSMLILI